MKHIRQWPLVAVLFSAILAPISAHAGFKNGNGGGGMVCPLPNGGLRVSLLDFWEAEFLQNRKLVSSTSQSIHSQISAAFARLPQTALYAEAATTSQWLATDLALQAGSVKFVDPRVGIAPPTDAANVFVERGCTLQGIAAYLDDAERLYVDGVNFRAMSLTGQAGLLVHEGIYRELRRKLNVADSVAARRITACAFSEQSCADLNIATGLPSAGPLYTCQAVDERLRSNTAGEKLYEFWAYKLDDAQTVFQFSRLPNGVVPPSRLSFVLNGVSFEAQASGGMKMLQQPAGAGSVGFFYLGDYTARSSTNFDQDLGLSVVLTMGLKTTHEMDSATDVLQFTMNDASIYCEQLR